MAQYLVLEVHVAEPLVSEGGCVWKQQPGLISDEVSSPSAGADCVLQDSRNAGHIEKKKSQGMSGWKRMLLSDLRRKELFKNIYCLQLCI